MDRGERRRRVKFALGLTGIFLATVELTLGVFAATASLVPGWGATVVASGSMEPALRRGDVVVYHDAPAASEANTIEAGAVIVFDTGTGSTIHRVARVNRDGTVTTRGDANRSADSTPVSSEMIAGDGFMVIPWIGLPNLWYLENNLPLLVGFILASIVMLQSSTLARDEKDDPWSSGPTRRGSPGWWLEASIPSLPASLLSADGRSVLLERGRQCGFPNTENRRVSQNPAAVTQPASAGPSCASS